MHYKTQKIISLYFALITVMIFESKDKNNTIIRLTEERWNHIKTEHPDVKIEDIKTTIESPTKITSSKYDQEVKWYYKYNKQIKEYLMVPVKYLNGEGFIITSFYVRKIK